MIPINRSILDSSEIHINRARWDDVVAKVMRCDDEDRPRVFICLHQLYYGWDCTCLGCGRRWSDGERMPLDFSRNARRDSKASARSSWRRFPGRRIER